jgi:DNA-binding NtrC family response regulator
VIDLPLELANQTIVIITSDSFDCTGLYASLCTLGYHVELVSEMESALLYLHDNIVQLLIAELADSQSDRFELLHRLKEIDPMVQLIYISPDPSIRTGVMAIQAGAGDCFPSDFRLEELVPSINTMLIKTYQLHDSDHYSRTGSSPVVFAGMIYKNEKMQAIVSMIDQIASTKATVLLLGESGVGKEVLAKMIHQKSLRKDKRFVVINCAAIPEQLIESELFGHEKGSFTGANFKRIGKFEQAQGGTVFLDEMGELSPEMQVRFLRVLQEKQLERVGSSDSINIDVRIIAATNKNLFNELECGKFREDLYYRLNVVKINIPPLRERREDIAEMVNIFLHEFSEDYGKHLEYVDIEAMHILINHNWKGNVRELRNAIERATVIARKHDTMLMREHLPLEICGQGSCLEGRAREELTLAEYEKMLIIFTMNKVKGSKTKAAEILGITRQTLYNKIKEYKI